MTRNNKILLDISISTIVVLILVSPLKAGLAQVPTDFEVASVKVSNLNGGQIGIFREGDTFYANNVTLDMLVRYAYNLQPYQVSGGPKWSDSRNFTIIAKIPPGTDAPQSTSGRQQLGQMLQALLRDRFKMTVRKESKMETAYELILSK